MSPQRLAIPTTQHLAAFGLAGVVTLSMLSSMLGLADGYRSEQQLAQAASQPVAAAVARKPKA